MLKAATFYVAVFVVGTATMILAHKLDPQKPTRSGAHPQLRFTNMSPVEAQDI